MFKMKKIVCLLVAVACVFTTFSKTKHSDSVITKDGDIPTEVRMAVDAANEIAPAKTWDGQYLKSLRLDEGKRIVVFYIKNVGGNASKLNELNEQEKIKEAVFFVANFMTAYDYSVEGTDGEGDEELFKKLGPLLKKLARNDFGVRFDLEFRKGGSCSLALSPIELERAVLLRKSDLWD